MPLKAYLHATNLGAAQPAIGRIATADLASFPKMSRMQLKGEQPFPGQYQRAH